TLLNRDADRMIRRTSGHGPCVYRTGTGKFFKTNNRGTRIMLFGIPNAVHRGARFIRGRERASVEGGWLRRDEAIMGTAIRVELWSEEAAAGEEAIDAVMAEMHRIDRAMSPFKPASE